MLRNMGLPELASEQGGRIDEMIAHLHFSMLAMFVGWGAFFLYLVIRYRSGRNPKASYQGVKGAIPMIFVALAFVEEMILLFGSSIPLFAARNAGPPKGAETVVVEVVAEQFAWNFHYPGPDGVFGRTDPKIIDSQTNPLGLDPNDPGGKDDIITTNQLHLPLGKYAVLHVTSKDVIHSFYLPEMRVKQDVIPGMMFPVWFKPTVSTAQMRERKGNPQFNYEVGCAQLCGLGHARMRGYLTIDTPEEFQAWLVEHTPKPKSAEDAFWN
jgi:cytochrome c oxidase subunit II